MVKKSWTYILDTGRLDDKIILIPKIFSKVCRGGVLIYENLQYSIFLDNNHNLAFYYGNFLIIKVQNLKERDTKFISIENIPTERKINSNQKSIQLIQEKNNSKREKNKLRNRISLMFVDWKLNNKKNCQKLNLTQSLTESQIEQIFQQKKYFDEIFIQSILLDNKANQVGIHLKNFGHLKGLGIQIFPKTLSDLAPLKLIAENLLTMKELENFQLIINCDGDSSKYVLGMSEMAQNLSSLQNLTHFSLHLEQTERMTYDVSNRLKKSLKKLKGLTHFEYYLQADQQHLFSLSSFQQLIKGLKYLTNLQCLQIAMKRKCPIGNEGFEYISQSLERLTNLQQLSLSFDQAQGTSLGALNPLKNSLKKLNTIKELNLEFNDQLFNLLEQFELFDAMLGLEEIVSFKVNSIFFSHDSFDFKLGANTFLNSKLKNIKFSFTDIDFIQKNNKSIQFEENILRITRLESLDLSLRNLNFNEKGGEVFEKLLKQNTQLQSLNISNQNPRSKRSSNNDFDFLTKINLLLNESSSLQKLSLIINNESELQSLQSSFSKSSISRLEDFTLNIYMNKLMEDDYDFAQVFQPLQFLKTLKLFVNIVQASTIFNVNLLKSLQYLPTLESLDLELFRFNAKADKQMFQVAFSKLVNLKKLNFFITAPQTQVSYSGIYNLFVSFKSLTKLEYLNLDIPSDEFNFMNQQIQLADNLIELHNLRVFEYSSGVQMIELEEIMYRKLIKLVILAHNFGG